MIFFKHTEISENVIKFEAIESDISTGECVLDLREKNALVSFVSYPSDKPFLAEGLIKAAYNYAATKNFYMAECTCTNIEALLLRLGFIKTGETYSLDIPSVLMGSCCKN